MRYIFLMFFLVTGVFAVGPKKVATFDRALWSEPINNQVAFNKASRHEIVSYVNQIIITDLSSEKKIKAFVSRKHVSLTSFKRWKIFTEKNLLINFKEAQKSCRKNEPLCSSVSTWNDLVRVAQNYTPPKELSQWYDASQTFFPIISMNKHV